MSIPDKITEKEWKQYVEQQMVHHGFTQRERDVVRSAFDSDLHDVEYGEQAPFLGLGQVRPGITADELKNTMNGLKDAHSALSKGAKLHLSPERIEKLEGILHEALIENKERLF